MSAPALSRTTLLWLGTNVAFAACHPSFARYLPEPVPSLATGAAIFLLPAIGWRVLHGGKRTAPEIATIRDIAVSTTVLLAAVAIHSIAGVVPTWRSMGGAAWLGTNLVFVLALLRRRTVAPSSSLIRKETVAGGVLFIASYLLYFYGATSVVPPMRDHDQEVQATGYGLATRFEPLLLTDRGTIFYFAHPPLLHFYVAASFIYRGTLPELEPYDQASRRSLNARRGQAAEAPTGLVAERRGTEAKYRVVGSDGRDYRIVPDGGGPEKRVAAETVELAIVTSLYDKNPHVLATRGPNLFLAALTIALLGIWAGRLSHHLGIGTLVAIAYATNPEVFVRSSYGGYFAIGSFTSLLMLLSVDRWWRHRSVLAAPAFLAGVLAALADHKMVLLPAAAALVGGIAFLRKDRGWRLLAALAVGFGAGSALFWTWGAAIAPGEFFRDHVASHIVDRITHDNPLGYSGYPTVAGLWREFAAHSGYVLLPIGLLAMLNDVVRPASTASHRVEGARSVWLTWTILVAVVFSIVDWRMTKHVVPMLIPLYVALVPGRFAPRWRVTTAVVVLLALVAWNLQSLAQLAANFEAFTITPVW